MIAMDNKVFWIESEFELQLRSPMCKYMHKDHIFKLKIL